MKRQDRLTLSETVPWSDRKRSRRHVLAWLIKTHGVRTMTEVGVRRGGTCFFLLDQFPDLLLTAIDNDISQFYDTDVQKQYGDRLRAIQGHSHRVADQIADASQDLIFIDADHSYRGCRGDILAYRPKLTANGLLTGHDIDYPGVNQAVTELVTGFDIAPNFVWIERKT
jgi:predicted O-methyltransferase YrrM